MPRESISTPSGASCRRPIPTSRHKKGNPFTPKCLVCRYVCAVMLYSPQSRFCAAPSGRRFFRRNPCPVAVLSRGDFFRRRFYADAHRRPAAGIASLLPSRSRRWAGTHLAGVPATRSADTPARAPGALVAEYPQHRAVGLLLGEEPRIVFVVALVAVDDDVLGCRDQAVLDAAETAQ